MNLSSKPRFVNIFNTKMPFLFKIVEFFTIFRKSQKFGYALNTGRGAGRPYQRTAWQSPKNVEIMRTIGVSYKNYLAHYW